jgi:hypothetical protein
VYIFLASEEIVNTVRKGVIGRAITQAVSSRLPTAVAQVRAQVKSCGICDEQSGIGAGSHRVLRFPLPILIPPTAPHPSAEAGGRSAKWTQSHTNSKKDRNNSGCIFLYLDFLTFVLGVYLITCRFII